MEVRLIPTEPQETRSQRGSMARHAVVSLELEDDDLNAEEFFDLLRRAAVAWGWSQKVVNEYMPAE